MTSSSPGGRSSRPPDPAEGTAAGRANDRSERSTDRAGRAFRRSRAVRPFGRCPCCVARRPWFLPLAVLDDVDLARADDERTDTGVALADDLLSRFVALLHRGVGDRLE